MIVCLFLLYRKLQVFSESSLPGGVFYWKRNSNISIFSLHSSLRWSRMGLKVVKSGEKWNKVVFKSPFRGRLLSYLTENAIAKIIERKQDVQGYMGQGDCRCSWENTITQLIQRAD